VPELHRPTPIGGALREPVGNIAPPPDRWVEDELDLGWYFRAILTRWQLLLAGALLGASIGFAAAHFRPVLYEATTTLLVVPPSLRTAGVVPSAVNPGTFRAILENASLASQVIRETGADQPPHNLTPHRFLERALVVEDIRGTNVVRLRVKLRDPKLAADATNRLALKAIALTRQLNQQEGSSVQDQLKNHLDDAAARMANAEVQLLSYRRTAQVELLEADTQAMLEERKDLLKLIISIESEKARLSSAEAEIKNQNRVLPVPRAVDAEEMLRRTDGTTEVLDSSNPFINPVYQSLDFQIATTRARLAGLQQQLRQVVEVRKLGGNELTRLSELYSRQIELARLQTGFDLARRVHSDLMVRYEESRTQALGFSSQLQLVDEAIPPDRPLSRRRIQYLALGFALGLFGAGLVALVWESRYNRSA